MTTYYYCQDCEKNHTELKKINLDGDNEFICPECHSDRIDEVIEETVESIVELYEGIIEKVYTFTTNELADAFTAEWLKDNDFENLDQYFNELSQGFTLKKEIHRRTSKVI